MLATRVKENATRKIAPGLGPKNSATGTEKIFRALMLGVKPDNFEAEACNMFKFFRLLSPVIEALSTSFFRRRKSCGE